MDIYAILIGAVAAATAFLLIFLFVGRFYGKMLQRYQKFLVELLVALFSFSLFLAIVSPQAQVHYLFFLMLVLFVVAIGVLVLGTRRVLEEYLTGLFVARVYNFHVGDYIEIGSIRGYITSLGDTYVVVRDPQREYVYIPYTIFLQKPFRQVRAPEGHEVRIKLYVPEQGSVSAVMDIVKNVANEFGLERTRVDVEKIGSRGVLLVVRGLLRDPRQEDELRYAIMDRVYSTFSKT